MTDHSDEVIDNEFRIVLEIADKLKEKYKDQLLTPALQEQMKCELGEILERRVRPSRNKEGWVLTVDGDKVTLEEQEQT